MNEWHYATVLIIGRPPPVSNGELGCNALYASAPADA